MLAVLFLAIASCAGKLFGLETRIDGITASFHDTMKAADITSLSHRRLRLFLAQV
jgi:hypothetical protein